MGWDATFDALSTPLALAAPDMEPQRMRPKPEHTGMGLHDIGARALPRCAGSTAGVHPYRVRKLCKAAEFATLAQALAQWRADRLARPEGARATIEIVDSATYHEAPCFTLDPGEQLRLCAVGAARPVLHIVGDVGAAKLVIHGGPGRRLALEGLTVTGGEIEIDEAPGGASDAAPFHVTLRHCRLLCERNRDAIGRTPWRQGSSLCVRASRVALRIEHCITGPLGVACAHGSGTTLHVQDSTLDGGHAAGLVITDGAHGAALIRASFLQSTVIGVVQVQEVELAEDCVFLGPLLVARRSHGCLRQCYVAPGSRTPSRTLCHPQLPRHTVAARPAALKALKALEAA